MGYFLNIFKASQKTHKKQVLAKKKPAKNKLTNRLGNKKEYGLFVSAPFPICQINQKGSILVVNGSFQKEFDFLLNHGDKRKKWFQHFKIDQTMMPQHEGIPRNQFHQEKTQEEIDLFFYDDETVELKKVLLPLLLNQRDVIEIAIRCPELDTAYRVSFFKLINKNQSRKTRVNSNTPVKIVAIFHDISIEYQLRKKLSNVASRDAIGQLVGGIAHDFNNMISITKGSIETLLEIIPPRANGYADLQRVQQSCEHASHFIKKITGLSRDIKTECYRLDFSTIIRDLEPLLVRIFKSDVPIKTYHDATSTSIFGNEVQIEQMILNIALNARDAMTQIPDKEHEFYIKTTNSKLDAPLFSAHGHIAAGNYLQVSLQDTGGGIPEEMIDKIFDPFFTTKDIGKGSGLGLGMVNSTIQQIGGGVTVENNEQGAVFSLYFKLADNDGSEFISSNDETILQSRNRVLLVDDEPAVRFFTAKMLRRYKYEVIEAENGINALKIAKVDRPDLLITDMRMPHMNGIELIKEIKKIESNLPIIGISGFVRDESFTEISHLSNLVFLAKPFNAQQLQENIKKLLFQAYLVDNK